MVCHLNKKGKNEFSNVISREAKSSVTEECVVAWLLFYFCAVLQAVCLFFILMKMNVISLMVIFLLLTFSEQTWIKGVFLQKKLQIKYEMKTNHYQKNFLFLCYNDNRKI